MSKPRLRDISQNQPDSSQAQRRDLPIGECPRADAEMTRVLKTAPLRMASDSSNGVITFWRHDPLHDVVKPMADNVIMAFPANVLDACLSTGSHWRRSPHLNTTLIARGHNR